MMISLCRRVPFVVFLKRFTWMQKSDKMRAHPSFALFHTNRQIQFTPHTFIYTSAGWLWMFGEDNSLLPLQYWSSWQQCLCRCRGRSYFLTHNPVEHCNVWKMKVFPSLAAFDELCGAAACLNTAQHNTIAHVTRIIATYGIGCAYKSGCCTWKSCFPLLGRIFPRIHMGKHDRTPRYRDETTHF